MNVHLKIIITLLRTLLTSFLLFFGLAVAAIAQEKPISLDEAIERSLEHATNTRIAKADKEAAEAGSGLLSSDYIPKINSSLSYTRSQYPQIVTPIRKQGAFPPLDDQLYEANIQAEWKVFDFGESRALRKKTKALADAANIKYELVRMETIESTTSAYIQLQQLKELKKVQIERVQSLKKNKEQLQALYQKGRIANVDLLKIEDTIVEAETALIETENTIDELLEVLTDDLGIEQKISIDLIASLRFKEDVLFNPDQASTNDAPSISVAKKQKKAVDFEARASYRAFLPQFNLFAVEQFRTGSEFEIDDQWMVGIRLNIPLFAGKKVVNNQVKKNRQNPSKSS